MPRLENWSVISQDPYAPPGTAGKLCGDVYDHSDPRHYDGKRIVTTRIASAEGRRVTTRSGTVYELGAPSPEYRAWVRESLGREIDPENPVVVVVA